MLKLNRMLTARGFKKMYGEDVWIKEDITIKRFRNDEGGSLAVGLVTPNGSEMFILGTEDEERFKERIKKL